MTCDTQQHRATHKASASDTRAVFVGADHAQSCIGICEDRGMFGMGFINDLLGEISVSFLRSCNDTECKANECTGEQQESS